jgi:transposase
MARRSFTVVEVARIMMLWHAGRSTLEVAHRLGVDPKTVRRYIASAGTAGLKPGQPTIDEETWRQQVQEWFPQLADPHLRQPAWIRIARHHDEIGELLEALPVSIIHRHLIEKAGLDVSVASLRRYVRANFNAADRRTRAPPRSADAREIADFRTARRRKRPRR